MKIIKAEALDKQDGTVYRVTVEMPKRDYSTVTDEFEAGCVQRFREAVGEAVDKALTALAES